MIDDTPGDHRVNEQGDIEITGKPFRPQCGNWFGLEGRHEENGDAPMELYMGNTSWATDHSRTIKKTLQEIQALGINLIRFPVTPQTLDPNDPMGQPGLWKNDPNSLNELTQYNGGKKVSNAREYMEAFLRLIDKESNGEMKVLLDIHSCSNYLGWRAGRLDANPPYADANRIGYNYKRETYSCGGGAVNDQSYNETLWLEDLRELANFPETLGIDNVIGIDIFNEPWDYTIEAWGTLAYKAYEAIAAENDDMLVFVEGVAGKTSAGVEVPHGNPTSNPNWGENFAGILDTDFIKIPKNRVVISPHTYGPSVHVQPQIVVGADDPSSPCYELDGDDARSASCDLEINATRLEAGWEEHFGYLRDKDYMVVVGEWGGNITWPATADLAVDRSGWAHVDPEIDLKWQKALANYMAKKDIQSCYWSINPESGDTGGLYKHAYHPVNNKSGWGEWQGLDTTKTSMLQKYWSGSTNQ